MKRRLNFISNWICVVSCFWTLQVGAQELEADTTAVAPVFSESSKLDSAKMVIDTLANASADSLLPKTNYPFLREVSVILDYGKVFGYLSGVEKKNEIGFQVNIKKMLTFHVEGGYSILNPNNAFVNADYEVKGRYLRVGMGMNKEVTEKNNLTFSFRYAQSNFEDSGTIKVTSSSGLFNDLETPFIRKSLTATWYELVLGSEKTFNPKFHMGFYVRFRIMDKYDVQEILDVYTIPGYGRTFDKTVPALNLYLRYVLVK